MIVVNGQAVAVRDGVSLAAVIGATTALTSGVAVAVNDEVIPRGQWHARVLRDGDRVEIVTAVQGG